MKQLACILALVLVLSLLCGCRAAVSADAPTDAEPQSDTAPVAPGNADPAPSSETPTESETEIDTTPEPIEPEVRERALDKDELTAFWLNFADAGSWYNRALTSEYARPEYVDLFQLFYNGIDGVDNTLSESERAFLEAEWGDGAFETSIFRLPADEMDKILRSYFGVALSDTYGYGLEQMTYFADEDCYYISHGDTNALQALIHSGVEREDGSVVLYYSPNGLQENAQATPDWMVTFQPAKDGYTIYANARANP